MLSSPPTPNGKSSSKSLGLTPTRYARLVSNNAFQTPPHILYLENLFLRMLRNQLPPRMLVELPVRHGKSEFFSRYLPAWYLSLFPEHMVILSGYGASFASEWGAQARNLFSSYSPRLFGLHLDEAKADHWTIKDHRGVCNTCGTGSAVSGKGAHLLIADDLVKDQAEAESATYRESTWKWFQGDLLSRLEPNGKAVVILSRRHPEDLVGRIHQLVESGGAPWNVVRLPALAEDNDPLGRAPGTPLWPERYGREALSRIQRDYELAGTGYLWDCLYMQNPIGDPTLTEWPPDYTSNLLYDTLPLTPDDIFCEIISLDPSLGRNAHTGDYGALLYLVADRKMHLWVEEAHLVRLPSDQLEQMTIELYSRQKADCVMIECNGFQEILAKNIQAKVPTIPIFPYISKFDKEVRIRMTLTPYLAQKRLHLKNCPGNQLLLSQLKAFPTGAHDDGPDSLCLGALAFHELIQKSQQRKSPSSNQRLRVG